MTAPGLYPEHDIFIQLMKLKNTLRWMRGEDLITHLGWSITTDACSVSGHRRDAVHRPPAGAEAARRAATQSPSCIASAKP